MCVFTYFSKMTQHIANQKKKFCLYGSWEGFQLFFSDRKCLFPVPTMQTGNTNFIVGGHEIPQNLRYIISMKKVNYNILLQCRLHAENDGWTLNPLETSPINKVKVCLSVLLFLQNDSRYRKSKKLFCLYGSWEGFPLFFSDRKCLFPVPTMQTGNTNITIGGREIPQNLR